ncbi:hypothetical protein COFA105466_10435 [Corynebacterium falsenii]
MSLDDPSRKPQSRPRQKRNKCPRQAKAAN